MEKVIELNLGIGINQFFPETTKIIIDIDSNEDVVEVNKENKSEN